MAVGVAINLDGGNCSNLGARPANIGRFYRNPGNSKSFYTSRLLGGAPSLGATGDDPMVSHPPHYISDSGMEVIDVIEAFTKGLSGIEAVDTANIIKYACRWKNKNGVQDLKKIVWYANHLIEQINKKEEQL